MIVKHHFMFSDDLAKLLPWVPDNAHRVVIDIHMNEPVLVYMELIADVDEVTVNALAGLTGGEVVTIAPKAGTTFEAVMDAFEKKEASAKSQPGKPANTSSKTDKLQGCRSHMPGPRLDLSNPPSDFTAIEGQVK